MLASWRSLSLIFRYVSKLVPWAFTFAIGLFVARPEAPLVTPHATLLRRAIQSRYWEADDKRTCVQDAYQLRIAELQDRYRLVQENGPFRFICDENPVNEVIVTFFKTEPPTLIAERGDSVSLMYLQPSGSGAKYQGRNETFWEHQAEASITWGYGAPQMHCTKAP